MDCTFLTPRLLVLGRDFSGPIFNDLDGSLTSELQWKEETLSLQIFLYHLQERLPRLPTNN